jgi:hypothetical protein
MLLSLLHPLLRVEWQPHARVARLPRQQHCRSSTWGAAKLKYRSLAWGAAKSVRYKNKKVSMLKLKIVFKKC